MIKGTYKWLSEASHLIDQAENASLGLRTHLSQAVSALQKALDLHRPYTFYLDESYCYVADDEHIDNRHVESSGERDTYICLDLPHRTVCSACTDNHSDPVEWPCPTVNVIEITLSEVDTSSQR